MPQLDTSSWFITITGTTLTLFIIFQLKFKTFTFHPQPQTKNFMHTKPTNPWELKWTKIYSPLSLPLHF
uniref:ATP synthase F0 subunit 8 n=1 Tax=Dipodomys spectabilis TaxID=105255 RepID=UPI00226D3358|nr:ATP synthase F0 subunit 8 [Dipodomys spectabilis]UZH94531.1 ATP synthase F0 subunit 8 [Dipodomys spectabilis]